MKLKHILLMATLALGATACDDDKTVVESVTGPTNVNVMSFNILENKSTQTGELAWKNRRGTVVALVDECRPDVMCTQGQVWTQTIYLDQQLAGYGMVDYNVNGNDNASGLHNTIYYRNDKYTVESQGRFWLSQSPTTMSYPWASKDNARRCASWVLLKDVSTHGRFYVVSTQYNDGDEAEDQDARTKSSDLIVSKGKELIADEEALWDYPVIVCGDFKATTAADDTRNGCLDSLYGWMEGARESAAVTDAEPSYNGLGSIKAGDRLTPDNIFMYGAKANEFKTIVDGYGVAYMSDHNPIMAKITF